MYTNPLFASIPRFHKKFIKYTLRAIAVYSLQCYRGCMSEKNYIKQQCQKLDREINSLQRFIDKCPEGRLISRKGKNGACYYYVKTTDESGKLQETYINKDQLDLALVLAKKEYALASLKDKKNEKWFIQQQFAHKTKPDHVTLLLEKHPGIAQLVLPTLKSYDDYVQAWKDADYKRSNFMPEHLKFTTIVPGLLVRSKSESSIVTLLEKHDVPYHFEEEYDINGVVLHPDFTCMNPRTHEIFYWEHYGKVDDPKYMKDQHRREELYQQAGIYPWINLLITTETDDTPLNLQWAETIIKNFLL